MHRQMLGWTGLALSLTVLASSGVVASAAEQTNGNAWLGVYSQSLTPELREGMDYRGAGVLVNRVVPDSPADRAGLEKGDIIVSVSRHPVDSPDALASTIQDQRPGDLVAIRLVRDGVPRTLNARLAAREDAGDAPKIEDRRSSGNDEDAPEADDPHRIVIRHELGDGPDAPDALPGIPSRDEIRKMVRDGKGDVRIFRTLGRGRLGVRIESLNPELGEYFGSEQGALVMEVVDDSPAKRAGIKAGDVITRAGDESVANASDLIGALRGKSGQVTIEVLRRGQRRTFEATLDAQRDDAGTPDGLKKFEWRSGGDSSGRMWSNDDGSSRTELQKQLRDLRDELEQLRKELNSMKQEK